MRVGLQLCYLSPGAGFLFLFFIARLSKLRLAKPNKTRQLGGKERRESNQEEITEGFLEGVQNGDGDKVSKSPKVRWSE